MTMSVRGIVRLYIIFPPKTWDKMASCPTSIHCFWARNVGQDDILSNEYSSFLGEKRGTRWHLVQRVFIVSGRETWDKMTCCPTNIHRFWARNVGQDDILSNEYSSFLGEKRGTR